MRTILILLRSMINKMDVATILPPESVRGMKQLEKDKFKMASSVPAIRLRPQMVSQCLKRFKNLLLRQPGIKRVQDYFQGDKLLLLTPFSSADGSGGVLSVEVSEWVASNGGEMTNHLLNLEYHNWSMHHLLKAVLPEDTEEIPSRFETIGHIAHLNLPSALAEYKYLIGQVLLDRNSQIRTVVNKTNNIDDTFRFFKMELLAGEDDMTATVKENGCQYTFDYSKVYWNSRLATEHRALIEVMDPGDIVVDVFAGVGPFSLPAAKKGCTVHANDLNPAAYHYLESNAKANKLSLQSYNLDGREFLSKMAVDLLKDTQHTVHIIMNLPASAVEFLDVFKDLNIRSNPFIHCYHFSKAADVKADTLMAVSNVLGVSLVDGTYTIHQVRDVAPKKLMLRISFELPLLILPQVSQQKQKVGMAGVDDDDDTPTSKRTKVDQRQ